MVAMVIPWRFMAIHGGFHGVPWGFMAIFAGEGDDGAPGGVGWPAGFFSLATIGYLKKFFGPHHHHHRIPAIPQIVGLATGAESGD